MPHIPDTPFKEIKSLTILGSKQEVVIYTCQVMSEEANSLNKFLYKIGDDLRKDQVVIQVFKLFDELCKLI